MKKWFLLLILLPALFLSCELSGSSKDKDDENEIETPGTETPTDSVLTKFDLSNAKSLMIRPRGVSASMRSSSTTNEFVKINEDGTVVEVTTIDQNGAPMTTTYNPVVLYSVNDIYILIGFGFDENNISEMYLIRLSDGAAFEVPSGYFVTRLWNEYKNAPAIQYDSFGNLYWACDYGLSLVKIDCSVPTNLTAQKVVDLSALESSFIEGFLVNGPGHILYEYHDSSTSTKVLRMRKSNGGIVNMVAEWLNAYWIGNSGNTKYAASSIIYEVAIDASYGVTTSQTAYPAGDWYFLSTSLGSSYLLRLSDETYIASIGSSGVINRVESDTAAIGTVPKDPLSTIGLAAASSSFLYLSGNNASGEPLLMRMDPITETPEVLLAAGLYDVLSLVVSADDEVTFNALRMADGKKVMGTIDAAGTVTIVDESSDAEVVSLIRVN